MSQPVNSESIRYSIPVRTALKSDETFEYSATDTIQKLNQWISDNQGAPFGLQRLYVAYGLTNLWKQIET